MPIVVWLHDGGTATLEMCHELAQALCEEGLPAKVIDVGGACEIPEPAIRMAEAHAAAGTMALMSAPFPGVAQLSSAQITHVVITTSAPSEADDPRVQVAIATSPIDLGQCAQALRGALAADSRSGYSDDERAVVESRLRDLGYL